VKWTYEHPKGQVNGVAVAADGTLYLGSSDGLLALDPAGTLKWTAALGEIDTTPTIAHDGSVLVTTSTLQGAVLHVVSPDGQEIWSHDGFSPDNPTVIDDGTAYVSIPGGKLGILAADRTIAGLIAVEPDWRSFGLAIAPGGDLVTWSYGNLPDDPGHLQRRSASGAWKWMVGVSCERVLVDGDGVTYCGDGAHIRAFDVAGAELWTREGRGVAVTHDGKLVSAVAGALRKYARDGQIEWATPLVMAGAPVIDAEDTLYVDTQGGVVAVGADGAVRWSLGASAWYLVLGREHELYAITTTTVTAVGP
jgi:outer membrane protein assembly factor BamB